MGERRDGEPPPAADRGAGDLAGALRRAAAERGLTTPEIVRRVRSRNAVTVYRVLAGTTPDPRASTLVALCAALDVDPDRLLGVSGPAELPDPELREALAQTRQLSVEDRWLLLTVLRAISRRGATPEPRRGSQARSASRRPSRIPSATPVSARRARAR